MPEPEKPVESLGQFVERVRTLRKSWGLPRHKELWFRGESRDYGDTILRPELYRPSEPGVSLKRIWKLLEIENELYNEFQRLAVERCNSATDDWDWDSYLLLQHHDGPTRLLDWSDGALMALHFALRNKADDRCDARVYVLEPYRLVEKLEECPAIKLLKGEWRKYATENPSYDLKPDRWDEAYLPRDEEPGEVKGPELPHPPLVMEFPHITRRIAAQRSRLILFGADPTWLFEEVKKSDSTIKMIEIDAGSRSKLRQELRDCGVTESVIYPDLDGLGREMRQLWEDRRAAPEENS